MTMRAEDGEIKYFRDGQHVSSTSAQFGYGSVSEGNYKVFVGKMAKETDDKGASEVSYGPFTKNWPERLVCAVTELSVHY